MNTFSIVVTFFIFSSAQDIEIWEASNLRAVVHFDGIEDYYSDLRREQRRNDPPTEPEEPRKRVSVIKRICKRVFTSHFFRMHQIDWVDIDFEEVRETLRNDHRDVFYTIFDEYEYQQIPGCLPLAGATGYGYDYRNLYRIRRVRVQQDDVGDEYVFSCVARERRTGALKVYYVSQPYNVNVVDWSYPIAGRFIFNVDEPSRIVAMAEDSALESLFVRKSKLVTLAYSMDRWRVRPIDTPELDPICSLSPAQKLRLCTSFFGISAFEKKVRFRPVLESVQTDCELKTISVAFARRGRFREWVIGCRALDEVSNEEVVHYVSRGSEANAIFVFRDAGHQRLFAYNFCNNVSVVRQLSTAANNVIDEVLEAAVTAALRAQPTGVRFFQEDVEN